MIGKQPLVSILVPIYNQAGIFPATLRSIVNQTYKNIEILISDDCSTDGARHELQEFSERDDRIRLFLQDRNLGITGNYNFLASKISGQYVAIFSGDDLMSADKIASQVDLLEKNPNASFCHHSVDILDSASGKSRGEISHRYDNSITTIHHILRNIGIPGSMTIMYRADAAEKPLFDTDIPTASDWLQMMHLSMAGQGLYIDKVLCRYRKDNAYNGKNPSAYEDDFIRTIAKARSRYAKPGDAIDQSCDYALARFSLGAGYRRMVRGERNVARIHFMKAKNELKFAPAVLLLMTFSYVALPTQALDAVKRLYKWFFK